MTCEVFPVVWVRWLEPGSGKQTSGCVQRPRGRWGGHWHTGSRQIWWFPRNQDDKWRERVKAELMKETVNKYIKYRPNLVCFNSVFWSSPHFLSCVLERNLSFGIKRIAKRWWGPGYSGWSTEGSSHWEIFYQNIEILSGKKSPTF